MHQTMASKKLSQQIKGEAKSLGETTEWLEKLATKDSLSAQEQQQLQALREAMAKISGENSAIPRPKEQEAEGCWRWDLQSNAITWNTNMREIFGVTEQEPLTEELYWNAVHPDDVVRLKKTVEKAIQQKGNYRIKHRIVKPNGELVWLDCQGKTDVKKGEVAAVYGVSRVATNIASSHFSSYQQYRVLAEHATEIVAFVDHKGIILDANIAVFEQLDWHPNELRGMDLWKFVDPTYAKKLQGFWNGSAKEAAHEWYGNVKLKHKSNGYHWFVIKAVPIRDKQDQFISMMLVAENANSQKLLGTHLGNGANKFSGISEEISEFAIVAIDINNKIRLWNKGAQRIFKYEEGAVVGKDFLQFLKPSGLEKMSPEEIFEKAIKTGDKQEWYGWLKAKDEDNFWGHLIINPQTTRKEGEEKQVLGHTLLIRNISERKFSDARFQSFLELGSDSVIIIDTKGKIYLVNKKAEQTFGYPREELLGNSIEMLVPDSFKSVHKSHRNGYLKSPEARPMAKQGVELFAKRKDGSVFPVEISLSPVETEKGMLILSSVRDVSQRVDNERKLRNAARELNLSYQRLQGIIDSSQDLIAAVDVNYNFIAFNRAFKVYFDQRYRTDIKAGDNLQKIYQTASNDYRELQPYWERALKGQEFSFELRLPDPEDKTERIYNITFNSIQEQNRRLLGATHVIRDITEEFKQREILKRSEDMLNDGQEFARLGSFEYDFKTQEVYCSDAIYELLGVKTVDAEVLRLMESEDREAISRAYQDLVEDGTPLHRLVHFKRVTDGANMVFSLAARRRITANGNPGIIGVIQDKTNDYRTQEELRKAKIKAEETAKLKQHFVANMSHEIRTPMNAILGFSRFLMEANLNTELKDYATNIFSSAENLLVLIDDILDFSKLEAGKVTIEAVDFSLENVLMHIERLFRLKAQQKGIRLLLKMSAELAEAYNGDPYRINQMLVNVVGNAIKFTESGNVTVSADVVKQSKKKHQIQIQVTDTGIGIPKNKLKTIFQSFSQAEGNTTRKYGGSGLGLSIVQNLLKILGGTIDVSSTVGEGSTFTLTFDLKIGDPTKLERTAAVDIQELSGEGYHVLLAEDNHNNQIITVKLLRDIGFTVTTADNGEEAIELFKRVNPDIVLMDIQMPLMDGVEAMQHIRKMEGDKFTPIVALTAHALIEERERYLEAGMQAYVSKPFKPHDLYQTVFKALGIAGGSTLAPKHRPMAADLVEEEQESTPTSKQVVDLSFLHDMVGGDMEVMREMLDIFMEDTPIYLKTIEEHLAKEDWDPIAKTCHTLKSSIGFMGRNDLVEFAQELQLQKTKPPADAPIRKTLAHFVSEIKKVLKYLEEHPDILEKTPWD